MDIEVKGDIISDDYAWIYDWLGYNYASPSKIINQIKEANGEELNIKVNSPGGDVFAASDIYTELRNYKGNVNINITGLAASAASVISMARHSSMSPTAQLMVHNVSSSASGDYRDMDHMSEVLKNANNTIANAYMCKSGMSREQALEIMNNETWLTAQQAKELGLIDEIMFEDTNKVNLMNLSNMNLKGFYNSASSIPKELIENLMKNNKPNKDQPIISDKVDLFIEQNAKINGKLSDLYNSQIEKKEVLINEN